MDIIIKRAYDHPSPDDGYRVLVDRLWPRGIKKHALALDEWCKSIAPSSDLRQWFGHDPKRFDIFRDNYLFELGNSDEPDKLLQHASNSTRLTLVYAAKDPLHNHALVLQMYLQHRQ